MTIYRGRQVNGVTSTYTLSKIGGEHKNCIGSMGTVGTANFLLCLDDN